MNIEKLAKHLKEFTLDEIEMIAECDCIIELERLLNSNKIVFEQGVYKYKEPKEEINFEIFISPKDKIKSIKVALNCGVKIICTIHAYDENDFFNKSQIPKLLETQAFEKIIFLKNANKTGQISKKRKVCELK